MISDRFTVSVLVRQFDTDKIVEKKQYMHRWEAILSLSNWHWCRFGAAMGTRALGLVINFFILPINDTYASSERRAR